LPADSSRLYKKVVRPFVKDQLGLPVFHSDQTLIEACSKVNGLTKK
jgi:hypothetical protein